MDCNSEAGVGVRRLTVRARQLSVPALKTPAERQTAAAIASEAPSK
jgi:hypothetical protein